MILVRIYEMCVFRPGTYDNKPAQKAHLLERERRAKDIRITNRSYFPNGSSVSNSSSCIIIGGKSDTNIVPSSQPCSVRVTRDGGSASAKTTSARHPSGCTNMRVISPKNWKKGRMSALTVFGGRPVSVMVVVEEEWSVSVSFSLEEGDS
jgi:hypothetical protein